MSTVSRQPVYQLRQLLAQMRERLQRGERERLPDMVRQYLDQVHAICTTADFCPSPEPLRQLLSEHQQVITQMHAQQQMFARTISSHRQSAHAARTYLSASADA